MLQGNPFETEFVIKERTMQVRQEAAPLQLPLKAQVHGKVQRWWQVLLSAARIPRHSTPNLEPQIERQ